MPSNHLELAVPLITTRAELAAAFGKEDASERASQPGIVTMREPHKKLFVFSDPHKSKENGYNFDGWTEGDEQGPVFDYTGTGPNGHQVLSGLNGTLLNHQEQGLELHLFISERGEKSGGAKSQRYVGQMVVDAEHPYTERWDYDKQNNLRKVYVFRLRSVDVDLTDIRPGDAVQPAQQTVVLPVPVPKPEDPVEPGARSRKTERHRTGQTVAKVAAGERVVNRREGILFTAFEEHLEAAGHAFNTFQISVKGEPTRLTPDLYDETDHALYEGKGLTTRSNVRMAMGQLLDYRRYIDNADTLRLVVLLPSEPTPDVKDLLQTEGFHLVFQTEESFTGFPLS